MTIEIIKWQLVYRDEQRIIKICCPVCEVWGDIPDHTVHEGGIIVPSIDCPECDFHDVVVLKGFPHNPYMGDSATFRVTKDKEA